MPLTALVRGGGDLASGVIIRLHRAGIRVLVTEIAHPLAVRRLVTFSQAILLGETTVEEVKAIRVNAFAEVVPAWERGWVPVTIDPDLAWLPKLQPDVIVDARMMKKRGDLEPSAAKMVIGLGPGFSAGQNCHAVIETQRGPFLGRVYWQGEASSDTGLPDAVGNYQSERVLRAPASGTLRARFQIGDRIEQGQTIFSVGGINVEAQFSGVLRGLLPDGYEVAEGLKVGDLDPRNDPRLVRLVSDKALAVGGGVMEAIFTRTDLRQKLSEV